MSGSGVERDGGTSDVHSAVHLESRGERNKDDECVELSDGDAGPSISDALHRHTLRPHLNNTPPTNLPFVDTFNGVVSRRAVIKVPTLFQGRRHKGSRDRRTPYNFYTP